MKEAEIKWIVFSSFIGAIREGVRAVAYDHDSDLISIYVYLAREPDVEDEEVVGVAITEIMASCPQFSRQRMEIYENREPIGRLKSYRGWVFVRCEG